MNVEHWRAMLPIIEAFVNGKPVERLLNSEWCLINDPDFDGPPERYRIKPEVPTPRTFLIHPEYPRHPVQIDFPYDIENYLKVGYIKVQEVL